MKWDFIDIFALGCLSLTLLFPYSFADACAYIQDSQDEAYIPFDMCILKCAGRCGNWRGDYIQASEMDSAQRQPTGATFQPFNGSKGSLLFNGQGGAIVHNGLPIDISYENFYIGVYVKTTSTKTNNTILDKRTIYNVGYHLTLYAGKVLFQIADHHYDNYYNPSSPNVNDGNWHKIEVIVYRNSQTGGILALDDHVIHTFNPTSHTGSLSNAEDLLVGEHAFSSRNNFVGSIDELRISKF
jgi:hypothetical protein